MNMMMIKAVAVMVCVALVAAEDGHCVRGDVEQTGCKICLCSAARTWKCSQVVTSACKAEATEATARGAVVLNVTTAPAPTPVPTLAPATPAPTSAPATATPPTPAPVVAVTAGDSFSFTTSFSSGSFALLTPEAEAEIRTILEDAGFEITGDLVFSEAADGSIVVTGDASTEDAMITNSEEAAAAVTTSVATALASESNTVLAAVVGTEVVSAVTVATPAPPTAAPVVTEESASDDVLSGAAMAGISAGAVVFVGVVSATVYYFLIRTPTAAAMATNEPLGTTNEPFDVQV